MPRSAQAVQPKSRLPTTVAISASISTLQAYSRMSRGSRHGRTNLTVIDVVLLVVVIAIVCATAVPLIEAANRRAQQSTLAQNLHTLRSQIELYKAEHGGRPPVLHEGMLPQMVQPTNADGVPGPAGGKYPFGPYLRSGVPINPVTGRSIVTATKTFPPTAASGNGGWLYHQETGQIAPDLDEYLGQNAAE
jgi:type II secretory pathway pseudopilin PulG